jgi:hypothetical protein
MATISSKTQAEVAADMDRAKQDLNKESASRTLSEGSSQPSSYFGRVHSKPVFNRRHL